MPLGHETDGKIQGCKEVRKTWDLCTYNVHTYIYKPHRLIESNTEYNIAMNECIHYADGRIQVVLENLHKYCTYEPGKISFCPFSGISSTHDMKFVYVTVVHTTSIHGLRYIATSVHIFTYWSSSLDLWLCSWTELFVHIE